MIKKAIGDALNEQINAEFHSAYLYLSMSAYFLSQGLAGYANWMRIQYQEELAHATRFFDYVNERGGIVKLTPIEEVQVDFLGVAIHESDHATKSFLQWFVDEQVEEEANVEQILHNLKLIKGEGQGMLMMDREMQTRVYVDPFAGVKA